MSSIPSGELRQVTIDQLRWSLRALASDCVVQLGLFPSFVPTATELALQYDDVMYLVRSDWDALDDHQRQLVESIHHELFSRWDEPFWSDDVLQRDVKWAELRIRARSTLEAFGWTYEVPPPPPHSSFVRG